MMNIYNMLNWENPLEVQSEGLRLAREIKDLSLLIQPPAPPSVWEHCAMILSEKSDDELEPYLIELLEWLQDLNWPGALTISERLKRFSGGKLLKPFMDCFMSANDSDDEQDSFWLMWLAELLENDDLRIRLPKEVIEVLKKHKSN